MNIPDHISESVLIIFWVNILQFFDADADPGSGNLIDPGSGTLIVPGSGIRDGKNSYPGSGINIPDPQHCEKPGPVHPPEQAK
jgi:hypothetical protein